MKKHQKITLKATGRTYTVKEVIELSEHKKDGSVIPYALKDFVPESDHIEPLIFYVAKPLAGREIYIGSESKEDMAKLFANCKIQIDLDRYYEIKEIICS